MVWDKQRIEEWRKKNKLETGQCYYCHNPGVYGKKWKYCAACRQRINAWKRRPEAKVKSASKQKLWRAKLRAEFIEAYGGKCECCGEAEPKFLTVEHPKGPWKSRKKSSATLGVSEYARLKREGWPKTVKLFCFNCNCGARMNEGHCPHEGTK